MLGLFSRKNNRRSIILDIQSDAVRGAVISSGDIGQNIMSFIEMNIPASVSLSNSQRMKKRIIKLAHDVVFQLMKNINYEKVHDIHYVLSSPWVLSELKTIKLSFDKETSINDELIDTFINKEIDKLPSKYDAYIFEKKIYDIKLNGYSVLLYKNRIANNLEINYSASQSDKSFVDELRHDVNKIIHVNKHKFHSSLLTQYLLLPKSISNNEYIYISIHGELSDMIMVKDHRCKYISSIPFGTKTIIRKISESTKHGIESVNSMLNMYFNNKIHNPDEEKVKKIIDDYSNKFNSLILDSLFEDFNIMHIPKTIYIKSNNYIEFFTNSLKSQDKITLEVIPVDPVVNKNGNDLLNLYTHVFDDMI